jgi:lipopolysaccharide transport system ATP-binding protein
MTDIAIRAENLSKRYRLGLKENLPDSLVGQMAKWARSPLANYRKLRSLSRFTDEEDSPDVLWALRDASFEIKRGEVVGIIGRNGAGKSTLLKILSRIVDPSAGQVEICGRVSSLLEVGTGFHPELTGRENVYLNGTILGMKKREIDAKYSQIVEFAGVDAFIETPVKRYSTGMMVRLAFAVAAHLEPEILIVDEVLAVGDAQFQKKSIGKMQAVARGEGRTVLFVSHNMAAIENLCQKVIVLEGGRVVMVADTKTGIREYLKRFCVTPETGDLARLPRQGTGAIRLTHYDLLDDEGKPIPSTMTGRDVTLSLKYRTSTGEPLKGRISFGVSVHQMTNDTLFNLYTYHTNQDFDEVPGAGSFRCHLRRLPLNPGRYLVWARVVVDDVEVDFPDEPVGYLDVDAGDFYGSGKLTTDRGYCPLVVDASFSCEEEVESCLAPLKEV